MNSRRIYVNQMFVILRRANYLRRAASDVYYHDNIYMYVE